MKSKGVDVVLVNPASRAKVYQGLGTDLAAIENPVWVGLIASFLRRRGRSVAVVDAEAESLSPAAAAAQAIDTDPRLVVVVVYGHQPSASTQHMTGASAVTTALKDLSPVTPVAMLGGHVAALPERTLNEERCDFVFRDEGLMGVAALVEALGSGSSPVLDKVPGLVYRHDGRIVSNGAAALVTDLEHEMPGDAWDLLPMDRYRAHNWHCFGHLERQPYAALYTTLGCPYRCSFCCIQAPFKGGEQVLGLKSTANSYRFWSPAHIAAQIDLLVARYGVRNIKIADEMFVLNERHVGGLCELLIERNYGLNIWAYARVDTVKPRMLDAMRRAGITWLALGIEAADERVLTDVDKRTSLQQTHDTVRAIKAAGINVIGNYIFGLPEDTYETMQHTLDLAIDLNCEFANFYSAMAYPGSPLYEQAIALGWRLPDSWSGYSQHAVDTLPLPTRHLSAGAVLQFRDRAFDTYFAGPAYRQLVRERFGADTVAHIERMTVHRLERKYASA